MSDLTEEVKIRAVVAKQGSTSIFLLFEDGQTEELVVVREPGGLIFAVDSSYIEQDVDTLISPYNNGPLVFE